VNSENRIGKSSFLSSEIGSIFGINYGIIIIIY